MGRRCPGRDGGEPRQRGGHLPRGHAQPWRPRHRGPLPGGRGLAGLRRSRSPTPSSGRRSRRGRRSTTPSTRAVGGSAANSGTDAWIGSATLNPGWWTASGKFGPGVNLPGGAAGTGDHIVLPNNIEQDLEDEFSVSIWANPRRPCPTGSRCSRSAAARTRSSCCSRPPRQPGPPASPPRSRHPATPTRSA